MQRLYHVLFMMPQYHEYSVWKYVQFNDFCRRFLWEIITLCAESIGGQHPNQWVHVTSIDCFNLSLYTVTTPFWGKISTNVGTLASHWVVLGLILIRLWKNPYLFHQPGGQGLFIGGSRRIIQQKCKQLCKIKCADKLRRQQISHPLTRNFRGDSQDHQLSWLSQRTIWLRGFCLRFVFVQMQTTR
jgi:hypothetical protein